MRARLLLALLFALLIGVVAYTAATPARAAEVQQATSIRRFGFPTRVNSSHTDAMFQVNQRGSGSILNLQDGGVNEYTFDQASATFINPLSMSNAAITNIGAAGTDFSATGGLTLADALVVSSGGSTVTGWNRLVAGSAISVTNGGIITPTTTLQPLESAGAVGASLSTAGATAGRLLYLYNTVNTTITITDTGNVVLSGNAALGQYDTLTLVADGTRWIQLAESDN